MFLTRYWRNCSTFLLFREYSLIDEEKIYRKNPKYSDTPKITLKFEQDGFTKE